MKSNNFSLNEYQSTHPTVLDSVQPSVFGFRVVYEEDSLMREAKAWKLPTLAIAFLIVVTGVGMYISLPATAQWLPLIMYVLTCYLCWIGLYAQMNWLINTAYVHGCSWFRNKIPMRWRAIWSKALRSA